MRNQILNLKEQIKPNKDVSSLKNSDDGNTKISRSNKKNKKRRERSKLYKSLSKEKWEEQAESRSETQDARPYLENKLARPGHIAIGIHLFEKISRGLGRVSCCERLDKWDEGSKIKVSTN